MIEIKNLGKSYGKTAVYENFNLSVEEGKITCILGESGSGKTTLLNCIAGLTPYTGGITNVKCSYIFQTPRLVPNLTVYKNLALICRDNEKITKILKQLRLESKAQSYPINLSGGEAQRVAIARAFLFGGDMILMDEPFSSLDLKLKTEIIQTFLEVWMDSGKTALFVTHDIDEAISLAHRVIVIKGGKIVYDFSPQTPVPRAYGSQEKFRADIIAALMQN